MTTSQIDSLSREIARLKMREAREQQKQADLIGKINRANDAASRTKNPSSLRSKTREAENANKELATVKKRLANLAGEIASKSKRLHDYEMRQAREDERKQKKLASERDRQARKDAEERKIAAEEQKRLIQERELHERRITKELSLRTQMHHQMSTINYSSQELYDFFISHASEDKDGFVRQLADVLRAKEASVWYDEFSLNIGDSLRKEIDRGLASSRWGVVILSEFFFMKEWPQKELNALFALETQGYSRILPIWHKVSVDEVIRYSPMLADKVALNTSLQSVEEIADKLLSFIVPVQQLC